MWGLSPQPRDQVSPLHRRSQPGCAAAGTVSAGRRPPPKDCPGGSVVGVACKGRTDRVADEGRRGRALSLSRHCRHIGGLRAVLQRLSENQFLAQSGGGCQHARAEPLPLSSVWPQANPRVPEWPWVVQEARVAGCARGRCDGHTRAHLPSARCSRGSGPTGKRRIPGTALTVLSLLFLIFVT